MAQRVIRLEISHSSMRQQGASRMITREQSGFEAVKITILIFNTIKRKEYVFLFLVRPPI